MQTPILIADSGLAVEPIYGGPDDMVMEVAMVLPKDPFGIGDAICTNVSLEDARQLRDWLSARIVEAEAALPHPTASEER